LDCRQSDSDMLRCWSELSTAVTLCCR